MQYPPNKLRLKARCRDAVGQRFIGKGRLGKTVFKNLKVGNAISVGQMSQS